MTKVSKEVEKTSIRHFFDDKSEKYYYSIVDIIDIATDTNDARNYWKVLKNRLKKSEPELVTRCNQHKMPAQDGKMYLTDTASSDTLLEIVGIVSPSRIEGIKEYFENIESENNLPIEAQDDSSAAELSIDGYENSTEIVIEAMIAGADVNDVQILIGYKSLTIRGKRINPNKFDEESIMTGELYWGAFTRTIDLPALIDIDKASATEHHGLFKIILPKINIERVRKIKIG